MNSRIIALNLPAKASTEIAGNPVITRLESAIANCFPGLEIDHRNLDRRFFPGLIFDFLSVSSAVPQSNGIGARLVAVDLDDPNVPKEKSFLEQLQRLQAALTNGKDIFLDSLQQGSSETIELSNKKESEGPLDGLVVWRLVRSLTPGEVTIVVAERVLTGPKKTYRELTAHRRTYQDKDGNLSGAYQPGELSQSLCSPWQHDFRDCSCNYWASNHPDIVMGAHPGDPSKLTKDAADAEQADRRLMWLRWDQSRPVPPLKTREECRPFEMDHYEINKRWQDLPLVLGGHELRTPYAPGLIKPAPPFPNARELVEKLHELAGIEHALALEYLFARYSIRMGDLTMTARQQQHADYIAHELLMIATSEMMHLRWVNQLLRDLSHSVDVAAPIPDLRVATHVPAGNGPRPVQMRPLDLAIEDFIDAEAPSGRIDGEYARVFATLRDSRTYPLQMAELASRIIADGVSHFTKFLDMRAILRQYASREQVQASRRGNAYLVPQLVRQTTPAKVGDDTVSLIKSLYGQIIHHLQQAYVADHADDRGGIASARQTMMKLDTEATNLAREHPLVGIPFSEIGYKLAGKNDNDPKR
jgi:hypothetical protein